MLFQLGGSEFTTADAVTIALASIAVIMSFYAVAKGCESFIAKRRSKKEHADNNARLTSQYQLVTENTGANDAQWTQAGLATGANARGTAVSQEQAASIAASAWVRPSENFVVDIDDRNAAVVNGFRNYRREGMDACPNGVGPNGSCMPFRNSRREGMCDPANLTATGECMEHYSKDKSVASPGNENDVIIEFNPALQTNTGLRGNTSTFRNNRPFYENFGDEHGFLVSMDNVNYSCSPQVAGATAQIAGQTSPAAASLPASASAATKPANSPADETVFASVQGVPTARPSDKRYLRLVPTKDQVLAAELPFSVNALGQAELTTTNASNRDMDQLLLQYGPDEITSANVALTGDNGFIVNELYKGNSVMLTDGVKDYVLKHIEDWINFQYNPTNAESFAVPSAYETMIEHLIPGARSQGALIPKTFHVTHDMARAGIVTTNRDRSGRQARWA